MTRDRRGRFVAEDLEITPGPDVQKLVALADADPKDLTADERVLRYEAGLTLFRLWCAVYQPRPDDPLADWAARRLRDSLPSQPRGYSKDKILAERFRHLREDLGLSWNEARNEVEERSGGQPTCSPHQSAGRGPGTSASSIERAYRRYLRRRDSSSERR
jgi:hypothetical protein